MSHFWYSKKLKEQIFVDKAFHILYNIFANKNKCSFFAWRFKMSGNFVILTVLEIIIATALIIGLFNEGRLADFEEKMFKKIKCLLFGRKIKCVSKNVNSCRKIKASASHSGRRCAWKMKFFLFINDWSIFYKNICFIA